MDRSHLATLLNDKSSLASASFFFNLVMQTQMTMNVHTYTYDLVSVEL